MYERGCHTHARTRHPDSLAAHVKLNFNFSIRLVSEAPSGPEKIVYERERAPTPRAVLLLGDDPSLSVAYLSLRWVVFLLLINRCSIGRELCGSTANGECVCEKICVERFARPFVVETMGNT